MQDLCELASGTWSYGYSPDGLRTTKAGPVSDVSYTWDRSGALPMLLATNTAGTGATYYIYGPGGLAYEQIDPDGSVYYLHHDQLGSTRSITASSGAVVGSASYDAYGNPVATTGDVTTDLGYAGQYVDAETGYQYLRARFYDPATGQFLTRDPAVGITRLAYGYTYGDPLNHVDRNGLWPWDGAVDWVSDHRHEIIDVATTVGAAVAVGAACGVTAGAACVVAVAVGAATIGFGAHVGSDALIDDEYDISLAEAAGRSLISSASGTACVFTFGQGCASATLGRSGTRAGLSGMARWTTRTEIAQIAGRGTAGAFWGSVWLSGRVGKDLMAEC